MSNSNESIAKTALRAFVRGTFTFVGFGFGIILIVIIASAGSISKQVPATDFEEAEVRYTPKVLPNADGKRKVIKDPKGIILVVDLIGVFGSEQLNGDTIREQLLESREGIFKKQSVKGIILNINSPGGGLITIDNIYRLFDEYRDRYKVPIFAYVDGMALSGGMYTAVVADKIFASDKSMLGSVGVILPPFINFSETLEKLGLEALTVSSGNGKDRMNPTRKWEEGEEAPFQSHSDFFYDKFVDLIVDRRPSVTREQLVNQLGADYFPAELAKDYGLVDEVGARMHDVIRAMAEEIGVGKNEYQVVVLKKKEGLFEAIFERQSPFITGKITHRIEGLTSSDPKLMYQPLLMSRPS